MLSNKVHTCPGFRLDLSEALPCEPTAKMNKEVVMLLFLESGAFRTYRPAHFSPQAFHLLCCPKVDEVPKPPVPPPKGVPNDLLNILPC